jgi:GMP synthase (glutamine-hydrolysing)
VNTAPFLIIETGQPVQSMKRHGGFPHWIRVAAGLQAGDADVVNVESGGQLPLHRDYAGVMITGSAAMVTDRAAWSERSADWLRNAAHGGVPLLGICYGHQLLAHALGGEVGDNPTGYEAGTVQIELNAHANDDVLFSTLPKQFLAHATHVQSVSRLPQETVVLAKSAQDACHAFRWRNHVWGVQFHPEFAAYHMRGYVHARAERLHNEGHNPHEVAQKVTATPQARKLLRRFVQHARGLKTGNRQEW